METGISDAGLVGRLLSAFRYDEGLGCCRLAATLDEAHSHSWKQLADAITSIRSASMRTGGLAQQIDKVKEADWLSNAALKTEYDRLRNEVHHWVRDVPYGASYVAFADAFGSMVRQDATRTIEALRLSVAMLPQSQEHDPADARESLDRQLVELSLYEVAQITADRIQIALGLPRATLADIGRFAFVPSYL
jgi:hypothetical protein